MSEVILCSKPVRVDFLKNTYGIDVNCSKSNTLHAFTPYVTGKELKSSDFQLISMLSVPQVAESLTNFSLSFGENNTIAFAELTQKLHEYNVGLIGASTSIYANRVSGFVGAVKNYQEALLAYRSAIKSNSTSKTIAKQNAFKAFQELQIQFRHELNAINAAVTSRRGTPLTSATRATNIARSSRNIAKLNITSQVQAHNLVRFTKHARLLGNGLAIIDFTSRIGNIHNEYKSDGNWERELFIESSSFIAGAITGAAVINAGSAALGFFVMATPVGWVGLVIGGLVVAGSAAAASIAMNNTVKNNSGEWYDSIMKALGVQ